MHVWHQRFERLRLRTPRLVAGDGYKLASVLAPIQERADGDYLILTKRSEHLNSHKGQVAFPGGRVDAEDDGPLETALRETHEEIGVAPRDVHVLGQLDQVVAGYKFLVTPFVGLIPYPCVFRPNPGETDAVFSVPVKALLDETALRLETRPNRPGPIYHFHYEKWDIWGATARMVKQLLEVVYGYSGGG